MADANTDVKYLSGEQHRLATFCSYRFVESVDNAQLAKAGFFLSTERDCVKCYACGLELKASDFISEQMDVLECHRTRKPMCSFIQNDYTNKSGRCKTFLSVADSLRFEKARLDTFLDWPVTFMSAADLAKDGFYFLRTRDHCACIFCKGIIGAWEETDTPREEHRKHFPQCAFIQGKPLGNVPMAQSLILAKFNQFASAKVCKPVEIILNCNQGNRGSDVTGNGIGLPSEDRTNEGTLQKNGINLREIGLHEYKGPKYKEYITVDSRMNSFKRWPERVKQHPLELAEAGFYYCGTSDHVRCFHCGNGICNWEDEDIPWDVHATWYPKCNYVLLTKGQEYVDKIQKGKLCEANGNVENITITEKDLDCLMELDIMRAVCSMVVCEGPVKRALRKKLETTGLPFFSFEHCMDSVLTLMEVETRQFLDDTGIEEDEREDLSSSMESSPLEPNVNVSRDVTSSSRNVSSLNSSLSKLNTSLPPPRANEELSSLPQLRTHVPIMPLPPRETSSTSGTAANITETVIENNRELSNPPTSLSQLPVQRDFSVRTPEKMVSSEASAKCVEQKSSNDLQEEVDKAREVMMCKVCLNAAMTIVFLPCSHMATCASCAVNLSKCPVCRGEIKYTIKPILI